MTQNADTSQEKATPAQPFDLPLRPGDWGDDIFDANEKQVVTLYGNERKPETAAQRDYVIRAVNSFDDMLAALKGILTCSTRMHSDPTNVCEHIAEARTAIAKAEKP